MMAVKRKPHERLMIRYWIRIFVRDLENKTRHAALCSPSKREPKNKTYYFAHHTGLLVKKSKIKNDYFCDRQKVFCHSVQRIIFLGEQPHVTDIK